MWDDHSNFGYSTIAAAPFPATTGTSLVVQSGDGALFPTTPFNCTIWPPGVQPLASNAEIVTVTAVVGDVLTITRAQEGTAAVAIVVGYQIANTTSKKVFTDIENSIILSVFAGGNSAGAPSISIADSPTIMWGFAGNTLTGSAVGGGGGGIGISAGGNSQSTGVVTFANSNGITFGLDGVGVMTASHDGITAQSTQPVAASASNGSFLFSTLGFVDGNGVTFGTGAGGIFASIAASAVPGIVFSAGTASSNLTKVVFSNSNNITFGLNGSVITASFFQSVIPIAAGSQQATAGVSFVNSNGITWGMSNSSDITASFNGLTTQTVQPVAASASNGSFLFSTLGFSNANGVTFGSSAGGIITASVAAGAAASITFSAGTSSAALNSLVFADSNGVSFGLNGSTLTASVATVGGAINFVEFEPQPAAVNGVFQALFSSFNTYIGAAFALPGNINNKYARMLLNFTMGATNATTLGSATATGSYGETGTFQAMFYSSGTGASSNSLILISSNTCSTCHVVSFSMTNTTQYTISHLISFPQEGVQSTFSSTKAFSTNSYVNSTSNVANFLGKKFMDFDLTASLTGGNYVFMAGQYSSDSSSGGALTAIKNFSLRQNSVFLNLITFQQNPYFGTGGGQTKAFNGLAWFLGTNTLSAIDFASISNNGSYAYFSLKT